MHSNNLICSAIAFDLKPTGEGFLWWIEMEIVSCRD